VINDDNSNLICLYTVRRRTGSQNTLLLYGAVNQKSLTPARLQQLPSYMKRNRKWDTRCLSYTPRRTVNILTAFSFPKCHKNYLLPFTRSLHMLFLYWHGVKVNVKLSLCFN
jgi:hypothetical protein